MKNALPCLSAALCLIASVAFGGSDSKDVVTSSKNPGPIVEINPGPKISFEFDAEESYVGDGDVERGGYSVRDFDENDFLIRFVLTPRVKFGILRLGAAYERFDFGIDSNNQIRNGIVGGGRFAFPLHAELPDRLEAANFVVGLDTEITDAFLIRIEAHPGWYGAGGDLFDGDNFRVPFIAGVTYVYGPTLQFTLGVGVNFEGKYPVLPGGGVRWQFAPQWVLNAVVPTPRLEYEVTKNFTIYAGAVIKTETYRVDDNFGDLAGDRRLNNARLGYTEVRTGLGVDWKPTSTITFSLEGGYLPYRDFDYFRPHVRYQEDGGAVYGGVALRVAL
jgi:opacity protein-like surface antigen